MQKGFAQSSEEGRRSYHASAKTILIVRAVGQLQSNDGKPTA